MIKLNCIQEVNKMEETKVFEKTEFEESLIKETIKEIAKTLEECSYNAIDQIVGYLVSGDYGYISSHNGSRKKIMRFNRNQILTVMLKYFIEK